MEQNTTAAVEAVDLSAAIPKDTGTLYIVVPGTNKRTGWAINFAGPGHPKTMAQTEEFSRAALDKAERIEMAQVNNRKWKGDGKQVADQRRENVAWVMGRALSWTPITSSSSHPIRSNCRRTPARNRSNALPSFWPRPT
jgi:hypothetical protein